MLGSASPRRLEILAQIGVTPDDIRPPDVNEDPLKGETPRAYCQRVTLDKVRAVSRNAGEIVLAADTTVALGRRIFGKPISMSLKSRNLEELEGAKAMVKRELDNNPDLKDKIFSSWVKTADTKKGARCGATFGIGSHAVQIESSIQP